MLSILLFAAFFIAGPLLTYWRGLMFALTYVVPVHAGAVAMLLSWFLADRKFWGLTLGQIAGMTLEVAICPGYLVNITHRMSWKYIKLDVDGAAYGMLRCNSHTLHEFKSSLNFALEELEQDFYDDKLELKRLSVYRKAVLS